MRDAGRLSRCCRDLRAAGVVQALLKSRPMAAKAKLNGEPPLHCAVKKQASDEVVAALLAAHPDAARAEGRNGELPLHCADRRQASVAVVAALLAAHPDAANS